MIKEVDEAILEVLRKALSEHVPPENIVIGELDTKKKKAISLLNTDFTIEELGIGGSASVKKEEIVEKFDSNGEKKDFTLSQKPLAPLISVESPIGTAKIEPDDYTVDYDRGTISFRAPPEKESDVQVKYYIARAVGETRNIKFVSTYSLTIWADDPVEKNQITLEAIKSLYRERAALQKRGIEKIKLLKGYSEKPSEEQTKKANIIEYLVETTIQIEIPLPPIERIEIEKI